MFNWDSDIFSDFSDGNCQYFIRNKSSNYAPRQISDSKNYRIELYLIHFDNFVP